MASRFISVCNRIVARQFHSTGSVLGADAREKRQGHLKKIDRVEGEFGSFEDSGAYEMIDENLMDKVINNQKFKDIPILHIKCTKNNTKISLTSGDGQEMIAIKSAGTEGYKHCRKGTTVAAQAVASRVITIMRDNEIKQARMMFNGLGPGRTTAFRTFEMSGLNIVSLSDRTQAAEPFNLRPRKRKRI